MNRGFKSILVLIFILLATQNTSKAQLFSKIGEIKIGNTYDEIVDQIHFDYEQKNGADSLLYIHIDNSMLERYYFFNEKNICYKEIHFPDSYQEQAELKKGLIVNSHLNPKLHEKINDNKWKIQKTDSSYVEIIISDYSNKSAFIYTYKNIEH